MRRPAAAGAAGLTAGIAVRDAAGAYGFAASAAFLLFCFIILCKKIENKEIKYKFGRRMKNSTGDEEDHASSVLRSAAAVKGRRLAVILFALCFLAGGLRYEWADRYVSVFSGLEGENVTVSGRVLSAAPDGEDRAVLVVDAVPAGNGMAGENTGDGTAGETAEAGSFREQEETGERRGRSEKLQVTVEGGVEEISGISSLTGWSVTVRGVVYSPSEAGNPGTFDYARYLRTRGIHMTMYAQTDDLRRLERPSGIFYVLERLAYLKSVYLSETERCMSGEAAALLTGIMFGDKNDLDEAEYEDFQKNGIAHLLAVSGMHISLIYGILNILFRRPKGLAGNLPIAAILIMYTAMCGFSPSVVRAVIMILIHIAAKITFRRYDFLSSISACAFCMLLYRPWMLFSAGFQLSFLAVLTLSIVIPKGGGYRNSEIPEEERKKDGQVSGEGKKDSGRAGNRRLVSLEQREWLKNSVRGQIQGTVLMQLGMLPLSLYHFHYISIGAFFLNIPAIALSDLIVPAGAALVPLTVVTGGTGLPPGIGSLAEGLLVFVCRMEEMLLSALTELNSVLAGTPLSYRYMASPPDAVFFLYYFALFFLCSEAGRALVKKSVKKAAAVLAAGALVCLAAGTFLQWDMARADLIFVDVGQGDCAHLKADGNIDLMFDSGGSDTYDVGKNTLIPYFLSNGVADIDLAVISHLHQDHCGGLRTMTEGVGVKKMLLSAAYESRAEEISGEFGIPREDIIFAAAGDILDIAGVRLTVLKPDRASAEAYERLLQDSEDENELCLIVRAEYRGGSVLFTGDIDASYEKELAERYGTEGESAQKLTIRSDILKVAHHGSRYSSCEEFLSAVSPKAAVIQVGRNYYGHPAKEAIDRLRNSGAEVFRNDLQGAIFFRFGKNSDVLTFRKR